MNLRLMRRAWSILAVGVFFFVGVWGRTVLPKPSEAVSAPIVYGAEAPFIGSITDIRARSSHSVNGEVTQAAWLVVEFKYKPDFAATLMTEIEARDGTKYEPNYPLSLACGLLYPQLETPCTLVVEMPKSDMPGARIKFSQWRYPLAPLAVVELDEEIEEAQNIVYDEMLSLKGEWE